MEANAYLAQIVRRHPLPLDARLLSIVTALSCVASLAVRAAADAAVATAYTRHVHSAVAVVACAAARGGAARVIKTIRAVVTALLKGWGDAVAGLLLGEHERVRLAQQRLQRQRVR